MLAGGIVITASHNPAKYNGFKIKGDFGGPAHPEMIAKVEADLAKVMKLKSVPAPKFSIDQLVEKKKVARIDMRQRYLIDLATKIDLNRIKNSGIKIIYDVMYGAGQGVLDEVLPGIRQIHHTFNPSFAGVNPEPLASNLTELMQTISAGGYDIGIATDGDADRIGAVDEKGKFVDSHRIFSILLKYLVRAERDDAEKSSNRFPSRRWSTTNARSTVCTMHETPIGFKYICRMMTERDVLIGGEESGGLGVKGHIPERDGIFLGLLLCEVMAVRKKPLSELVQELMDEFGQHEFHRIDLHVTEREKIAIMKKYQKGVKEIGGYARHRTARTPTGSNFSWRVAGCWCARPVQSR